MIAIILGMMRFDDDGHGEDDDANDYERDGVVVLVDDPTRIRGGTEGRGFPAGGS